MELQLRENLKKEEKLNKRGFATKWGFIIASIGSAVGMANVWGFPYRVGGNGGGAFLLAYLVFVFIFSVVGLPTEFAMGRKTKTGTLGCYEYAFSKKGEKSKKIGKIVGWIPLIGSLCIAIGYAVIVAYVLKALFNSVTGELMTVNTGQWFESFALTNYSVVPFHIIIIGLTILTLMLGAKSIEKTNKIIMPIFFGIFIILALRVLLMKGAIKGYAFMLIPRFEALKNPMVWIFAMGQAFFSLSITGSGMLVYGAYLDDKVDVVDSSQKIAIFDTIAAVVATFVIIPACFAYKVDVGSGPGLLFVTLPKILQNIHLGRFFAIILYLAMIFAGISSLQNMFEVVAESLMFKFKGLKRNMALGIIASIALLVGINMEAISSWGPWMDLISIYIIPVGATIGAITWFFFMDKEELLTEINKGCQGKKRGNGWYLIGRCIYVPIALTLCLVALFMKISF